MVFLLLVFFLLAGTLEPTQPFPVDPPISDHSSPPASIPLLVLLDEQGRLGFEGRTLDAETLSRTIAARLESRDTRMVQIKADAKTVTDRIRPLLKRLQAVGVTEFQLLTRKNPETAEH